MGLRYFATWQSEDDTRDRIKDGVCLVAVIDGRIVGTATYQRSNPCGAIKWYDRPDVATVGQLAVEPELQRHGIGSALMQEIERIALAEGATELALNTAEPATHLIDYYTKHGFRIVE